MGRIHRVAGWSEGRMSSNDYQSLFVSLNDALAVLDRNRTPAPEFVAAFDTLKQARAKILRMIRDVPSKADAAQRGDLAAA